jgi:surface antigen
MIARSTTAAVCSAALLLSSVPAAAQPGGAPSVAGVWTTTYGEATLSVSDRRDAQGRIISREVSGPYKGEGGRLKGELQGSTLTGYWFEPNASIQCNTAREGTRYWGRIIFVFNPAADRFDGKWGYCEAAPASSDWSGQRLAASASRGVGAPGGSQAAPPAASASATRSGGRAGGGPAGAGCPSSARNSVAGAFASSLGGALLNRGLNRLNVPHDFGVRSTVHGLLVDKIACLLSPQERQQAAQATEQAVQRGVGATASWESRDRPGVAGRSTVAAEQAHAGGGICRVVNDVVIVDGEETTVQKRMCRAPGASGFTLQT